MRIISTVQGRILLGVIVPLLVLSAGTASLTLYKMRDYAIHNFEIRSSQEINLFTSYVANVLETVKNNAAMLAKSSGVISGYGKFPNFKNETEDKEYRRSELSSEAQAIIEPLVLLLGAYKDYEEVFIGYADGSYATAVEQTKVKAGTDISRRGWYLDCVQAAEEVVLSDVYQSITDEQVVTVAHKIKDASGRTIGAMGIDLSLDFLFQLVHQMKMGETGRFTLIEQKTGRVLVASARPDFAGKALGKEVSSPGLEYLLHQPDGIHEVELGGQATMGFSTTTDFGWKIIYLEDESEIFKEADNTLLILSIAGTLITVLMILMGFVLARSVVRPLHYLVDNADAVSAGNLESSIDSRLFYGELSQLHIALSRMLEKLKHVISEARQQTAEAERQTEIARQAVQEAETARNHAESAKREGMLAAAEQLEGVVKVISAASSELSEQVEQSDRGAAEASGRLSEAATAMNEMASTVQEVARNAAAASRMSVETKRQALNGADIVRNSLEATQRVHEVSLELKNDMAELNSHATAITQIMGIISDIADQTNLLALNAAIEAARAGEAGRGFAVVADEVRKLAEKTMASTNEVGGAIKAIQGSMTKSLSAVDNAVEHIGQARDFAGQAGQALEIIVRDTEEASDEVSAIATASEEQSAAGDEINNSISEVNNTVARIAHALTGSAKAVSGLAQQARNLSRLVEEMKKQ